MASVKKVQYEELSEDQIAAARRRRSRTRCGARARPRYLFVTAVRGEAAWRES